MKYIFSATFVALLFMAVLASGCIGGEKAAPSETVAPEETAPPAVTLAKGRAFTAGHGGHLAVIDFAINPKTKEFTIYSIGRLVAYSPDGKKYGAEKASHTVSLSKDGKTLYWAALDGTITEIDLDAVGLTLDKAPVGTLKEWRTYKAKDVEWAELGGETDNLHCGSSLSPDGKTLYVSSIGSGAVLVYDTTTHKKVDKIPVDAFGCTAEVTPDGKYLYFANMAAGVVDKVDLSTREIVKKIDTTQYNGYFLHIGELAPDGRYLWQTAANEFKEGKPYNIPIEGASGIGQGYVIIIDTVNDKVVDALNVPGNPHDVTFTKDGRFAILSARHLPENPTSSGLVLVDTTEKKVISEHDVCGACHDELGADVSEFIDPETQVLTNLGLLEHPETGLALACGIDITWEKSTTLGCM